MSAERGIVGRIAAERHGGAARGMIELAIVAEEMGRVLLCAPYLSSAVLATSALELAADEAADGQFDKAATVVQSAIDALTEDVSAEMVRLNIQLQAYRNSQSLSDDSLLSGR